MVQDGEMRRSEEEFSDTISRGMSDALAIVALFVLRAFRKSLKLGSFDETQF